jgi:hypothetical protein
MRSLQPWCSSIPREIKYMIYGRSLTLRPVRMLCDCFFVLIAVCYFAGDIWEIFDVATCFIVRMYVRDCLFVPLLVSYQEIRYHIKPFVSESTLSKIEDGPPRPFVMPLGPNFAALKTSKRRNQNVKTPSWTNFSISSRVNANANCFILEVFGVCICIHVHVHIYTYIYAYIHTYGSKAPGHLDTRPLRS